MGLSSNKKEDTNLFFDKVKFNATNTSGASLHQMTKAQNRFKETQ